MCTQKLDIMPRVSKPISLAIFSALLLIATLGLAQTSAPAQPAAPQQQTQAAPAPRGTTTTTIVTDPVQTQAPAQPNAQSAPAQGTAQPQQTTGQTAQPAPDQAQGAQQGQPAQGQQGQPAEESQMPANNKDTVVLPSGQQPAGQQAGQVDSQVQEENGQFVIHTQVEEVVLHATVVDEKGRLVTDLPKTAFTVYENGKVQQITHFQREDVPVALGILIDNSGSMRDKRQKVNQAAINLVKSSNPEDKVFVVNFNEEFYLDQDFTGSIPKLREALEKIDSRGGTAMYDAVDASAKYLEDNSSRLDKEFHIQKKALLIVTDGEDNSSRDTLEQIKRKLEDENAPVVYTIGILGDEHSRRAKRALQQLAEQTGGLAFFPKDVNEVDSISQTIARDIRSQYTIAFKKNPGQDAGYRSIKVIAHAPGHKNLQVRTLTGYFANGQQRASR
jgi:VWFA-related protein